ncbi:unnamed protein product [Choristocarpus tenellus]
MCIMKRLSVGTRNGHVDEDLPNALDVLRLKPGGKPSQTSIDAARAWISVEDNNEVTNAILEDMKDQLLEESLYHSDNESSGDENDNGFKGGGTPLGFMRKGAISSVFSILPLR